MSRMRIGLAAVVITAIGLMSFQLSDAHHMVLRFNLEEMTATADRIFVGRCVAVDEGEEMIAQGMMPVTRYTFEVERAMKGRIPRRFTFRQLGHTARGKIAKRGEITMHGRVVTPDSFHGMSEYAVGDRVVLFLIPNYLGGKVTYPVGLYQGALSVSTMSSGEELARNNINNLGLFTAPYNGFTLKAEEARVVFPDRDQPLPDLSSMGISGGSLARKRGSLPVNQLMDLVDHIVAAHGGEKGVVIP